jgi:hypothetical protein
MPIGFGFFQAAVFTEKCKTVGYLGRTGRSGGAGIFGRSKITRQRFSTFTGKSWRKSTVNPNKQTPSILYNRNAIMNTNQTLPSKG